MLEIKNVIVESSTMTTTPEWMPTGNDKRSRLIRLKGLMDIKCASYLRLCSTKNVINRAVDYHYLNLCVQQSTAPVNDIDYIHPVVKPCVDYATAVISKGLCPNGEISFEFMPDNERDAAGARQATLMVSEVLNNMNDPHKFLHEWIMDACMHKNGMMMVQPVRESTPLMKTTEGTLDQLKAYELRAEEMGLKVQRQSRRKINVDAEKVLAELAEFRQGQQAAEADATVERSLENLRAQIDLGMEDSELAMPDTTAIVDEQQQAVTDAVNRNTIYRARYKLTGYSLNVRLRHIPQHYWICDPNVTEIQEQPFCGFYQPMSIQEAMELYPDIDLEEFRMHAEYNQNGAYQAGSVLNNLAIHARDSMPTMGLPVGSASAADQDARQITVLTCWDRFDIDGDGELELIEIICSGAYIISAKEVEFIPVANMNPKPLPGNFFGMSIGESVIPMQEYLTAAHRAEIQLGLLQSTSRLGVKPDRVDFEMLMDGEAAIFVLDSKFDPSTDVYPLPVPQGDISFLADSMQRIDQDKMAMIGMTQPTDVFNPEVMTPGNSGIKLQMALSPNQLIQDDTVKNCSEGLKEAIWLVWRTLVQYGDDYGVKKLASKTSDSEEPVFLDYKSFDDLDFCERKQIHIDLALGMRSEENALSRLQIIKQCQMELYQLTEAMVRAGTLTPEVYTKVKKPFQEILYTVGVKQCDTYLPTDEEVMKMIKQGQEAARQQQPSPEDQKRLSEVKLNNAKTIEIEAELAGTDATTQIEYLQIASGHSAADIK